MKRFLLISILPILLLLFNVTAVVLACSGCAGCTWMDIENDLGDNTIIVRGTGNTYSGRASVYVSEYIVGEPDYPSLRVYYSGKGHGNSAIMGYYSGSCGSGAKYPSSDEEAYYIMTRQQDGTYRINHIIGFPSEYPQFVDWDNDGEWEFYSLTEEEFLERIHANPQAPLYMDIEFPPIPLANPVIIHTENDSLYLLPVDARTEDDIVFIIENARKFQSMDTYIAITTDDKLILHETLTGIQWTWDYPQGVDCTIIDCLEFSENGVIMTRQVDADTIQICELALIYPNSNYVSEPTAEGHPCVRDTPVAYYNGAGVSFSADSSTMAVWHDNQMTIYGGLSWIINMLRWEEDQVIVTSTTIDLPEHGETASWFAGRGVWSEDSRWLAYSDSQGLWLWDVFTQDPQLFLAVGETGAIPYARYFSDSGRYLAVSIGNEHFIMDRFSDLIFPDGVVSPDERMMIRRDTVNLRPVPAETCSLLDGQCSSLIETEGDSAHMIDAYWVNYSVNPNVWNPSYTLVDSPEQSQDSGFYTSSLYSIYRTEAFTISFYNGMPVNINAESILDSPIKSLTELPR